MRCPIFILAGLAVLALAGLMAMLAAVWATQTATAQPPFSPLDTACSDGDIICKTVEFRDDDGDGIIEVGEPVDFFEVIEVQNPSPGAWTNTEGTDSWGAEIDVTSATPSKGTATLTTKGRSAKEFLRWDIGTLGPGETATLVLEAKTDLTPGGDQSYTECSIHEFNSGAVLKFLNPLGKKVSFETGGILVSVLTVDLLGDCDGDGIADASDNCNGTPNGPALGPNNQTDSDGDGLGDVCDPTPTHDLAIGNMAVFGPAPLFISANGTFMSVESDAQNLDTSAETGDLSLSVTSANPDITSGGTPCTISGTASPMLPGMTALNLAGGASQNNVWLVIINCPDGTFVNTTPVLTATLSIARTTAADTGAIAGSTNTPTSAGVESDTTNNSDSKLKQLFIVP